MLLKVRSGQSLATELVLFHRISRSWLNLLNLLAYFHTLHSLSTTFVPLCVFGCFLWIIFMVSFHKCVYGFENPPWKLWRVYCIHHNFKYLFALFWSDIFNVCTRLKVTLLLYLQLYSKNFHSFFPSGCLKQLFFHTFFDLIHLAHYFKFCSLYVGS